MLAILIKSDLIDSFVLQNVSAASNGLALYPQPR